MTENTQNTKEFPWLETTKEKQNTKEDQGWAIAVRRGSSESLFLPSPGRFSLEK